MAFGHVSPMAHINGLLGQVCLNQGKVKNSGVREKPERFAGEGAKRSNRKISSPGETSAIAIGEQWDQGKTREITARNRSPNERMVGNVKRA